MEPSTRSEKESAGGTATGECVNRIPVPRPPSIEEFDIVKPISRGAFGKVYLGQKGGKLYAVKVVKKADMINKNMTHQVQAERDALALSKSPFIVHLYYSLQSASNVYLVMEYLIGGDVKSLLHIYGYFDEEMAVKYVSEVALALDYLHRHGIIHRDLKPDNMLISNEGHIKLTDFGLSKVTLNRDINMMDILTTPSMAKPRQDYSRTPGQVLSLISSLGFNTSVVEKNQDSADILSTHLSEISQFSQDTCPMSIDEKDATSYSSKLLKSCLETLTSNPGIPVKCLTSNLLQSRKRLATSSASSQSHTFISSVESECHSSPKWEKDCQENDEALGSTTVSLNTTEKLCAESTNAIEIQSFHKKDLELALSPIHDSSAVPAPGSSRGNLAPKCFSEEVSWEAGELEINIKTATDPRQSDFHQVDQWAVDSAEISEEYLGKRSLKRNFELVDSSPCQEIIQNKKSCVEYKHDNETINCYTNPSTGLTGDVQNLKLSTHRSQQNDYANKENIVTTFIDKQQTPEKLSIPMIAKNLMCELDKDCEKNNKKGLLSSSFLCSDDDRASTSIYMNSDSSLPEISIMESSLERQSLDPDKSIKESSFEESNIEDLINVSPNCEENTLPKGVENSAIQDSDQKMLAPSLEGLKMFTSKRNAVAFRSFNSHITASNNSEPSKMNTASLDAMEISCAYTGSYPMAITPTQKGRVSMPYQGRWDYVACRTCLQVTAISSYITGPAVDWWALGVCLFEFLTGIPPFNDETPQQVFQNILKRDIPWPEGEEKLSDNAQSAVEILLTIDDTKRAGMKELKHHPLFSDVDWENLQHQTMPFIPQPEDATDTSYFEARNNAQHLTVSGFSL
ncbi:serine/threonine-protein kinase greatwall [Otolemur garnettii]|uniref:serine/threonine-protein kinase greatwall n=1 Tax=Otolemur garnettii TaxID=30611 RepID=UPI0006446E93|nr:serine/threonine-protein kinase greatwall [Otolemur garnettii]